MERDVYKELLKDIVLCYVYKDRKMFYRRLKKANSYIYNNSNNINNIYITNINNINHLLYHTTELKKKLDELVKDLNLAKKIRYRTGICSECGGEGMEIKKSGMCSTCDTRTSQAKCSKCGKWRRIKAWGMCYKCYHHNVVKPDREKQKQKRECGVDGAKDKQRKDTVSNAVQVYYQRDRAN